MKETRRVLCAVMAALVIFMAPMTSYMEASAVEIAGGIALYEILKGLIVTVGCFSIGYVTVKQGEDAKERQESMERAILADTKVAAALEDAAEWERSVGGHALKEDYTYTSPTGFRVVNGSGNSNKPGKNVTVGLNQGLIVAARNAAKAWADSEANTIDAPAGADKAGTETVSSQYMSSIVTTVKPLPAVDSMEDMDAMFGVSGACSYFKSRGYSDTAYYWLVYVGGGSTWFMPVPYGYSVVGYHAAWLGFSDVCIISNADYKNTIVQNGVRDSSAFLSYLRALPEYTGRHYSYDVKSAEWREYDGNYLPGGSRADKFRMSNWYTCGYRGSYSGGSLISWNNYFATLERTLYTYDSVGKFFEYDYSKAPSVPEGGLSFTIPESDYEGFGDRDLASLIEYITSLSEELRDMLEEQEKNQEEIIQQGKDTLEAINNMHATIGKVSSVVGDISAAMGKILAAVLSVGKAVEALPAEIAEALGGSVVLPGLDGLADAVTALPEAIVRGLAEILPGIITDAVADVFPDARGVGDAIIALPDSIAGVLEGIVIEIPEIKIPEIVIPEIAVPDVNVTLNPDYDITVRNDFTGLGDIISSAVASVLSDCFVPDEAATLDKFSDMQDFFRFRDDITAAVADLEEMLFGITPSPILKIPIGKPTSRKYDYGTGSYIIIDISWYAQYKQFGDKVVLAIAWALFLWRLYIKLPGIISGTEGSIVAADRAHDRYEKTKDSGRG